jgi:hypothetical protein
MTTRVLNIVGTAYRATVEEQDDTVLWLTSMCNGAGLDVTVLLEGNAVNYAVRGQDASGLSFGDVELANPPTIDHDVEALLGAGVGVLYVREDAERLGLQDVALVGGVKPVTRGEVPTLMAWYDQVWRW